MIMEKILKNYIEKFGDIPRSFYERFILVLKENKIKDKDIEPLREEIRRVRSIRWEKMYFTFFIEPSSCPRPRLNRSFRGRKNFVFVKGAREHKDLFDEFIDAVDAYPLIKTPCKLHIEIFAKTPSSMKRYEKVLAELKLIDNVSKPDFDNYAKRYADMIQKTLILDDCLIAESRIRKKYSSKPRIEIIIEYATEYDSEYNRKKVEKWKG